MKQREVDMKNIDQPPYSIGILGLHRSAGVTHVSVLLAHFLSDVMGLKTAITEVSGRHDLYSLLGENVSPSKVNHLKWRNITILDTYRQDDNHCNDFDCVIYDMGSFSHKWKETRIKLDKGLLLFMTAPWMQAMTSFTTIWDDLPSGNNNWQAVANLTTKHKQKQLGRLPTKPYVISFEPDMSLPSRDTIQLFDHIFYSDIKTLKQYRKDNP